MTTTKKKAKVKRNPWPPWLDALDDVRELLKAVERRAMDESRKSNARLTALEQAQRPAECSICHGDGIYVSPSLGSEIECPNCGPSVSRNPPTRAEKPAAEKRAGPWVSVGRHAHRKCTKGMPVCAVESLFIGRWQAWAVNADSQVTHWWGTQYATEALARAACDAELVRLGWTLDEPPAPAATSEDAHLRDAVVDAALAWGGPGWLGPGRMIDATAALRAHRAKKGGA